MIFAVAPTTGLPLESVRRSAQASSQMFARKTSEHRPAEGILAANPGDALGGAIECRDAPRVIDGENAL